MKLSVELKRDWEVYICWWREQQRFNREICTRNTEQYTEVWFQSSGDSMEQRGWLIQVSCSTHAEFSECRWSHQAGTAAVFNFYIWPTSDYLKGSLIIESDISKKFMWGWRLGWEKEWVRCVEVSKMGWRGRVGWWWDCC